MADAADSKSVARKGVWVQVPPPALENKAFLILTSRAAHRDKVAKPFQTLRVGLGRKIGGVGGADAGPLFGLRGASRPLASLNAGFRGLCPGMIPAAGEETRPLGPD